MILEPVVTVLDEISRGEHTPESATERVLRLSNLCKPYQKDEAISLLFKSHKDWLSECKRDEEDFEGLYRPCEDEVYRYIFEGAEKDSEGFYAALMLTIHLLENSEEKLPEQVRAFIVKIITGQITPPANRSFGKTYHRDFVIAHAIYTLVTGFNLSATRNASSPTKSAADIVAEVSSGILDYTITFDTACRCWKQFRKAMDAYQYLSAYNEA